MKLLLAGLLMVALVVPATGGSCKGGKCLSRSQWNSMKKKSMEQRLAKPVRVTPAMVKINQQIQLLSRTNIKGRNNAAIQNLHNQRNQMVQSQR